MNPSRRRFLGGCFAAIATMALPSAGVAAGPRYWLKVQVLSYSNIISGLRNDGLFFFAKSSDHSGSHTLLNEFLDPTCVCDLNGYCEKHSYLDRGGATSRDRPEIACDSL